MAVVVHALLSPPLLSPANCQHGCELASPRSRLTRAAGSRSQFIKVRAGGSRHESEDGPSTSSVERSRGSSDFELRQRDWGLSSIVRRVHREWTQATGEVESAWTTSKTQSGDIGQEISLTVVAAIATGLFLWGGSNALAVDALKTCGCLLKECRVELAKCIADPKCGANVACLQTCNGRPDETECQIGCGDLFENKVVDEFNDCAVTRKGCVPQKADEGRFPVPPPAALVPEFKTTDFTGTWYISSGLNKTFDTFDCQEHQFSAEPSKLSGNLNWRIATPDGGFFTRSTVQNFVQDPQQPGILYNHGNEFLHYQDDWYVLSSKIERKPTDYVFIYYRGKNDAWDGYGGAVVYTRSRTLPPSIIPELQAAAKRVNLDFNKFTATDNTCGPEPPLFARLEKKVEQGEEFVEKEVEEAERNIETVGEKIQKVEKLLLSRLGLGAQELRRDEEQFLRELGDEERQLLTDLQMGASDIEKLFGNAIPIRKYR